MSTSVTSRPFARSGFLIAMLAGAAVGTVAARMFEAAKGGADPEFVGILGAAFGGILGRSLWMRVRRARDAGRPAATPVLLLLARIALCAAVAVALFGAPTLSTGARVGIALLGGLAYAALGVVEVRWFGAAGGPHVD
jgi:uncharacterized membrane protein YhaH (DUF805 family)